MIICDHCLRASLLTVIGDCEPYVSRKDINWDDISTIFHSATISIRMIFQQYFNVIQYPPRRYFNNNLIVQRYLTARYFNSSAECNNIHKDNIPTILHYYTTISTVAIFQQYFKVQQNPPGRYFKKQAHRQLTKSNSPLIWHLAKYRFRVGTDSAAHTCTHRYQCIAMVKLRRSK